MPDYNIGIEFDGQQHFRPVSIFGGDTGFIKTQKRDEIKTKLCLENNCKLFRVKYNSINDDLKVVVE